MVTSSDIRSQGKAVARRIEETVRKLGWIQEDALIQTLINLDIRESLARMGVMNPDTSVESMSRKLRRWIPASD